MYTWIGAFLGYTVMLQQIIYLDLETGRVKWAKHACFDEGMFGEMNITPNARELHAYAGLQPPSKDDYIAPPKNFNIMAQSMPFLTLIDEELDKTCTSLTLGLTITKEPLQQRAYIVNCMPCSTAAHVHGGKRKILHCYLIQVNNTPIYSCQEVLEALQQASDDGKPSAHLVFAPR